MANRKLSDKIRAEIVIRFACWETQAQIRAWLQEAHGIEVVHAALSYYNMDNRASRNSAAGKKWASLFDETRKQYVADVQSVRTSHQAERVRIRDMLIERQIYDELGEPRKRINVLLVKDLLKDQAQETGGMFTNRRVVDGNAVGALAQLLGCDPAELPTPGGDADA